MGVYVFDAELWCAPSPPDARRRLAARFRPRHPAGPLVSTQKLFAYPFVDENKKQTAYWRDIGTLDSYYEASMDLVAVEPVFNLYDKHWPLRTMIQQLPPPRRCSPRKSRAGRLGIVLDSIVSGRRDRQREPRRALRPRPGCA